jgi:hypothetical protein
VLARVRVYSTGGRYTRNDDNQVPATLGCLAAAPAHHYTNACVSSSTKRKEHNRMVGSGVQCTRNCNSLGDMLLYCQVSATGFMLHCSLQQTLAYDTKLQVA